MYCCVAVHAVPSTSADVCIIIKLTAISWSNYCKESYDTAVNLTEAGRQSATVACTGVLITNAVTVIIHTLVLVLILVLVSSIVEIMHSCIAVHAILSTGADVCIIIKLTLRDSQWINCCRDGDVIAVSLTKARRQSATVACTGVLITNAVAVIIHTLVLVLVLVLVSSIVEIMHSCVAVHAVLSTSADVCVIIKHTAISWTNLPRESNAIAIRLTEAGRQSATRACTGVLITNAVTVITPALVLICLVVEAMHSCVAVHTVLSTNAEVCVVI